jgi:hypothetical protein
MRHGVLLAFALALAASRSALADPTPTTLQAARDLFAKAEADEDAGRWSEALDKLRRAASVKITPGIRFHIALCEEKLNQLVAALADYVAADEQAHEQNNKDVIDAVAEPLRALRIRVPTLTIDVPTAAGVVVELDGKEIAAGLYGITMPVEPGLHHVRAIATGKRPFTTEVQMSEREAQTTVVKWVDAPPVATHETEPAIQKPPPSTETSGGPKWGAIVSTVSAAAALGFGIGAFVAAGDAQSTLFAQCASMTSCDGLKTPVRTWDAVALGSFIGAAGLTTLAIVLWVKPSTPARVTSAPTARIELRPGGLAVSGSF